MTRFSLIALGLAALLPHTLADRGSATYIEPTVCNNDPTQTTTVTDPPETEAADVITSSANAPPATTDAPASTLAVKVRRAPSPPSLVKRGGTVTFADSCNKDIPTGNGYGDAGFKTMKDVLQQAYNDAVALATKAQSVANDNKGLTHYFGDNDANLFQKQVDHFKAMMAAVADDQTHYTIEFECENVPDCSGKSVMVTDANAGPGPADKKVIEVCPEFWTSASTRYLIYTSDKTTPNPPYRDNTGEPKQWCPKDDQGRSNLANNYYATAGHSVLHELTHLSALGNTAGLDGEPQVGASRFGTIDAQDGCEMAGARKFLRDYIAGKTSETSPDYNAESYAAAATEIYFMDLCQFTEIRPIAR